MKASAKSKEARALWKQLREFPFLWGISQTWKPGRETVTVQNITDEDDWNDLSDQEPSRTFVVFTASDGTVFLQEVIDEEVWVAVTRIDIHHPGTTFDYIVMAYINTLPGESQSRFFVYRPSRGRSIRGLCKI